MNNILENSLNQTIDLLKKSSANYYEISLSQEDGIASSVRMGKVDSLQKHLNTSIGITAYIGQKSGYVSGSDLSSQGLKSLVDSALSIANYTEADPFSGGAPDNRLAWQCPDLELFNPDIPSLDEMIESITSCEASALAVPGIENSEGCELSYFKAHRFYANAAGLVLNRRLSQHSLSCSVIASDKNDKQTAYDYHDVIAFSDLADVKTIGVNAANFALEKLGAKSLNSQTCPVIFTNKLASGLFRQLLKGLGGGAQYKKSTFLLDKLGEQITPDWLSIQEKPLQLATIGSQAYDGDGVLKQDQYFLKDGVVQSYVMGQYSANQLQQQTTGNSGGISNCYLPNSQTGGLDCLVKTMQTGLVVTELMGQGINLTNGNYSRGAAGFWVENGQQKYRVSGITIAGNLAQMLQDIVAISDDVDVRQKIKVGSTLISNMTVSG